MSNFCPDIFNIFHLLTKIILVQFSWMVFYFRFSPEFVYINNVLYIPNHTQLSCKFNNYGMVKYGGRHITIHTEEKPFKCDNCRMVKYGGQLTTMHTGEKPFKWNNNGMVKYGG